MLGIALVGRNNIMTFALGLSHERAVWWHGLAMGLATGLSLYHGVTEHLVNPKYQGQYK